MHIHVCINTNSNILEKATSWGWQAVNANTCTHIHDQISWMIMCNSDIQFLSLCVPATWDLQWTNLSTPECTRCLSTWPLLNQTTSKWLNESYRRSFLAMVCTCILPLCSKQQWRQFTRDFVTTYLSLCNRSLSSRMFACRVMDYR